MKCVCFCQTVSQFSNNKLKNLFNENVFKFLKIISFIKLKRFTKNTQIFISLPFYFHRTKNDAQEFNGIKFNGNVCQDLTPYPSDFPTLFRCNFTTAGLVDHIETFFHSFMYSITWPDSNEWIVCDSLLFSTIVVVLLFNLPISCETVNYPHCPEKHLFHLSNIVILMFLSQINIALTSS